VVRWRPGQSSAPWCSNLRFFGSKCTVLKKVLVTLFGLFGAPAVIWCPHSDSALGVMFPSCPPSLRPCLRETAPRKFCDIQVSISKYIRHISQSERNLKQNALPSRSGQSATRHGRTSCTTSLVVGRSSWPKPETFTPRGRFDYLKGYI